MRAFFSARKYPTILTCLSIGILVGGVWLKPNKRSNTEAMVSETETVRLLQIGQKRSLEEMTEYFSRVANDAGAQLVYVPRLGAGIIWNQEGEIVTIGAGAGSGVEPPVKVLLPDGREVPATLLPSDAPVGALRISNSTVSKSLKQVRPGITSVGSWVIQVARRADRSLLFTPGIYRETRAVTCAGIPFFEIDTSIDLKPAMAGGGLFDLDGDFLGVVAPCGDRTIILRASDVQAALHPKPDPVRTLEKQWGTKLSALDESSRAYFHSDAGLLVQEVGGEGLAARSGLEPGDILLALGDQPVESLAVFQSQASAASEDTKLTVLRRGRKRVLTVAGPPPEVAAADTGNGDIGLRMETPAEGYLVENVTPESVAGRAGVRAGDRLLEVNGARVRRLADLDKLLKKPSDAPLYLLVSRGERQLGILLP